jgi:hypothetical protein
MYLDPFWDQRFGERGRRFAEEDNLHHISYLVQTLRTDSAELLTAYVRWLQRVLTTRGMCSRHIEENFERLAEAMHAEQIADAGPALTLLDAASAALAYDDGPAQAVQRAAGQASEQIAKTVAERHASWPAGLDGSGRSWYQNDARYLLSFLADALANERPDRFAEHVRWANGFYARQGRPSRYLAELLSALDESLQETLGDAGEAVSAVVAAGRAAVAADGEA